MITASAASEIWSVYRASPPAGAQGNVEDELLRAETAHMARGLGLDAPAGAVPDFPRATGEILRRTPALKDLSRRDLFDLWIEAARAPRDPALAAWDEKLLRGTEIMYGEARRKFTARYGSRAEGDAMLLLLSCYLLRRSSDLRDLRLLNLAMKNVGAVTWASRPSAIAGRLRHADSNVRFSGGVAACAALGASCLVRRMRETP